MSGENSEFLIRDFSGFFWIGAHQLFGHPQLPTGGSAETDPFWGVIDGDLILFFQTQNFVTFSKISISNRHVLERPYSIMVIEN